MLGFKRKKDRDVLYALSGAERASVEAFKEVADAANAKVVALLNAIIVREDLPSDSTYHPAALEFRRAAPRELTSADRYCPAAFVAPRIVAPEAP